MTLQKEAVSGGRDKWVKSDLPEMEFEATVARSVHAMTLSEGTLAQTMMSKTTVDNAPAACAVSQGSQAGGSPSKSLPHPVPESSKSFPPPAVSAKTPTQQMIDNPLSVDTLPSSVKPDESYVAHAIKEKMHTSSSLLISMTDMGGGKMSHCAHYIDNILTHRDRDRFLRDLKEFVSLVIVQTFSEKPVEMANIVIIGTHKDEIADVVKHQETSAAINET